MKQTITITSLKLNKKTEIKFKQTKTTGNVVLESNIKDLLTCCDRTSYASSPMSIIFN